MLFEPIGIVQHDYPDDEVRRRRVEGLILVYDRYVEGLRGLDEFSHIIVISYLHKYRGSPLVVRPRRLEARGLQAPEVGVFATDSPDRPNPIGVSIIKLLEVRGNTLRVSDLDLFNGTPVLDIKGFSPTRCPRDAKAPDWALADHV
ncbi:MAG: tRNA (N6-threonylcarbamoyladenosine(37)-N6)-methyltransferase TrmO [Thermoproteus sp.]